MEAHTTTHKHRSGSFLLRNGPALRRPNWLPEGLWPELDELAAEHEERLRHHDEANATVQRLRKEFEEEDAAQVRAHKEGGTAKVTSQVERDQQLTDAERIVKAEGEALAEFVLKGVEAIEAHEADWLADLERHEREADDKREEARRLLAEAERAVGEVKRTRVWVQRNAHAAHVNRSPREYIGHEALHVPEPTAEPDLAGISGWGRGDEEDAEQETDGGWVSHEPESAAAFARKEM